MEKRREILRSKRVCRFCLKVEEPLTSIYDRSVRAKNSVPLPLQIMACVAIEVFPSDGMPGTICSVCRHFMDQSYRFKQMCKQADEGLRHFLTHGDLRDPIAWPRDMIKHVPENLLTPVVQQTITVTEEEYSEEEGEPQMKHEIKEEEVEVKVVKARGRPRKRPPSESTSTSTNVIITPTNSSHRIRKNISTDEAEEPPTKIRVTQRGEELLITAHGDDEQDEDLEDEEEMLNNQPETVETDVFPCPHCLRSFPLKQLLDIHQEQHTRERTHHCQLCERSFFSKFDLQKHMVIHTGVKPFKCIVCKKTFARLTLLRRHEKVHANIERQQCGECSQSFITADDLHSHIERKHLTTKPFKCDHCTKTFAFKQGLDRHALNHSREQPFRCDYCPLSFSSSTRLARHLQCHAGQRPYPCKFCPKSFLMSHHYMRHLRTKHIPKSGNEKTVDSYKCIQCDELFDKQDDLIFHSAVHATQDLTCPLCKEKFEDVDSVTMHIKSHIDGEQYICEWCELVFTTEENLDLHIDAEHKDAMPGDHFTEITYLEGRLVDQSELLQMNQSYEGEELEEEEEEGEVDSIYDGNQQETKEDIELDVEEEEEAEDQDDEEQETDVAVVQDNSKTASDELSFQMNVPQPVDSPQNHSEDDSKPTYIELKTVAPTQAFTKKPIEIVQKNALTPSTVSPPKSSILQKAQEVKAQRKLAEELKEKQRISSGVQKVENKSFKPIPIQPLQEAAATPSPKLENSEKKVFTSQVHKIVPKSHVIVSNQHSKGSPIIKKIEILSPPRDVLKDSSASSSSKDAIKKIIRNSYDVSSEEKTSAPVSRTNEKSLKLLEKDLLELQKVAKSSNSSDRYMSGSQRFLSRKPLSPSKRDHDNRDSKHGNHRSDDRDFRITAPKRTDAHEDRDSKSSSKRESSGSRDDRHSKIRPAKRDSVRDEKNRDSSKDSRKSSGGGDTEKERKKISESSGDDNPSKKSSEVFKSPHVVKKNDGSISVKKGFMQRDAEKNKSHTPVYPKASSSEDKSEGPPTRAFSPALANIKSEAGESESKSLMSDDDAGPTRRRSCRASKIKDYAAMIRSRLTREDDDSDEDSDDDYRQSSEEDPEDDFAVSARLPSVKPTPLPLSTSTPLPTGKRGRGRPRKVPITVVGMANTSDVTPVTPKPTELAPAVDSPIKTPRPKGRPSKKSLEERALMEAIAREKGVLPPDFVDCASPVVKRPRGRPPINKSAKLAAAASPVTPLDIKPKQIVEKSPVKVDPLLSSQTMRIQKIEGVVQSVSASGQTVHMSPLGQTLKKVSAEMVRSLPPGVRPLPMPPRTQLTQMKIGPKIVRVQKILMTKAEVDAMAKKGLVEIKDGAVVLKAGVKLPASGDFSSLKSILYSPSTSDSQTATASKSTEPDTSQVNAIANTAAEESAPLEENKATATEPAVKATLPDREPAKPSRCQDDVLDPDENDIST